MDVCICLELLAHIHYMVLFWDSPGLPIEPDLLHSAGVLLRGLIRDLLAAVTEHRRVWHMDTQGATHVRIRYILGYIYSLTMPP